MFGKKDANVLFGLLVFELGDKLHFKNIYDNYLVINRFKVFGSQSRVESMFSVWGIARQISIQDMPQNT